MADEFHTKDIDKLYQICFQFFGKKITIRKTKYKHKIENIFYEYTYLVTIPKYTPKNLPTNIILSCLLPSKGKVLKHITIQQLD